MHSIRPSILLCAKAWILSGILAALPLHAQTTNLEMVALSGGRLIGAATACGINAARVRKTSDRLLWLVNEKADSAKEKESAAKLFTSAQGAGAAEIRLEKSNCAGIHVEFSEIEVRLGRVPGAAKDAVAARRGVPPLGALPADKSAGNVRR